MTQRPWTTPEAAHYLRLSEEALLSLRHRGNAPPAVRVGRRLLWPPEAVEAWLDAKLRDGQ